MHIEVMQEQVMIGPFLVHKIGNMVRWLKENGCIVDLPPVTNVSTVLMAQELRRHLQSVQARDFDAVLTNKELPPQILMAVAFVRNNAHLHDKFWRYMDLFSDTVA